MRSAWNRSRKYQAINPGEAFGNNQLISPRNNPKTLRPKASRKAGRTRTRRRTNRRRTGRTPRAAPNPTFDPATGTRYSTAQRLGWRPRRLRQSARPESVTAVRERPKTRSLAADDDSQGSTVRPTGRPARCCVDRFRRDLSQQSGCGHSGWLGLSGETVFRGLSPDMPSTFLRRWHEPRQVIAAVELQPACWYKRPSPDGHRRPRRCATPAIWRRFQDQADRHGRSRASRCCSSARKSRPIGLLREKSKLVASTRCNGPSGISSGATGK